ncbi:hypothetical protein [Halobaculum gomorrense]|nr:hypothetical protein [Halobaculum gomorrense]
MAAKQPAVGIDHVTVVPTNAARGDDPTADRDAVDADEANEAGVGPGDDPGDDRAGDDA